MADRARPSDHEVRVFCLLLAHEAEEETLQTMARAHMYHGFLTDGIAHQAQGDEPNVVPFTHAAKPL